jgi:pimeloyl-ACP methyl ester carboxylesterase
MATLKLNDGRHLAFEQYGAENGIPVFFQHGFGDSRLARHPDNKLTTKAGIRLITADRPGYGESSRQPGRTFLNWVPDIEQLADHLKIDRFGVMSHSGGSPYAMAIAYQLKDRVTKLVMVSPLGQLNVPGASETMHKSFRFLLKLGWFKPLIRLAGYKEAKRANSDIARYAEDWLKESPEPDKTLFTEPALRKMFEDGMKEAFKQGGAGWVDDIFAGLNWGFSPGEIKCPVKIFHGSADELLFAEMGRRLAKQIPHAEFQLYEGEGHYSLYMHWFEILSTFRGFSNSLLDLEHIDPSLASGV